MESMRMKINTNKNFLNRKIVVWLASFSLVAIVLIFYFKAPPFPIILAGLITLTITLVKNRGK